MSVMPSPDEAGSDDQPTPSGAGESRADWLVGPEEGLAAEMEQREAESRKLARPTLLRPTLPPAAPAPPAPAPPAPLQTPAAAPAPAPRPLGVVQPQETSEITRGPGMIWQPGTMSVPMVRGTTPAHRAPEPTHDFPMDDAEERARDRASALSAAAASAAAAAAPHAVVSPEAFNVAAAAVPWWMQFMHTLRTDRRIQVLLAVVIVVLTALALWPRGERPVSVAALRRHPGSYDGVEVRVNGRVGEVFHVGQGYAFYLLDDRDSLVVFTRSRQPRARQHVSLLGSLSTGYLDGQRTLALFESTSR